MRHTADRPDPAPCNTLHFRPEQALVGAATGIDQTTFHRVVETVAGENVQPGASLKNPLEMKSMPHPSIHSKQVAVKGGGMRGRG